MTSPLPDRPHYVYELIRSNGEHLYVGCTSNLSQRLANHAATKEWFTDVARVEADLYPDQRSALDAERERIELYQPIGNSVFTDGHDAGGWQKRKANMAASHAAGQPCGYGPCRSCRNLAHSLGVRCPKYACNDCRAYMPLEYYLGGEVETACWYELVRRHGADYAHALCESSQSALEALSFDEADIPIDAIREERDEALRAAAIGRRWAS